MLLGVALPIGLLCFHTGCAAQTEPENTAEELQALYTAAVRDAVLADTDEIQPLVCLTHEDERTVWDEDGERVLLLSMNYDPDSDPAGEDITFHGGEIWAFSGGGNGRLVRGEPKGCDGLVVTHESVAGTSG